MKVSELIKFLSSMSNQDAEIYVSHKAFYYNISNMIYDFKNKKLRFVLGKEITQRDYYLKDNSKNYSNIFDNINGK